MSEAPPIVRCASKIGCDEADAWQRATYQESDDGTNPYLANCQNKSAQIYHTLGGLDLRVGVHLGRICYV